jgi:hypothetical protein
MHPTYAMDAVNLWVDSTQPTQGVSEHVAPAHPRIVRMHPTYAMDAVNPWVDRTQPT